MAKLSDKTKKYRIILNNYKVDVQVLDRFNVDTIFVTIYFKIQDIRESGYTSGQFNGQILDYITLLLKKETKELMKDRMFFRSQHILLVNVPENCKSIGCSDLEITLYLKDKINFSFKEKDIMPETIELRDIAEELAVILELAIEQTKLAIPSFPVSPKVKKQEEDIYDYSLIDVK